MEKLFEQTYYEILDVSSDSSTEQIKKAYLLACQTYKSNSMAVYSLFSENETKEILKNIEKAYLVLVNPETRKSYDQSLFGEERQNLELETSKSQGENRVLEIEMPEPQDKLLKEQWLAAPRAAKKFIKKKKEEFNERSESSPYPDKVEDKKEKKDIILQIISNTDKFTGAVFRETRELLGYSLEDVCNVTKIRLTYLKGIEAEEMGQLPARIYIRGFVENYCAFLGLPIKKATQDYMSSVFD